MSLWNQTENIFAKIWHGTSNFPQTWILEPTSLSAEQQAFLHICWDDEGKSDPTAPTTYLQNWICVVVILFLCVRTYVFWLFMLNFSLLLKNVHH